MANTATPRGSRFNGIFYNGVNNRLQIYDRGTLAMTIDGNDVTIADDLTVADVVASGTLTGNALTVVTGVVSIDEIAYTFPAADGANTTQLTTNGSGALAWLPADDGAA
jgi:hypothetical protein